jgi:outer membrane protein assembly factor BamB
MKKLPLTLVLVGLLAVDIVAGDWPMAGFDARRSHATPEELPLPLALRWTYHAAHPPMPAWPRSDRQTFDRCYHPVVSKGLLFFGSSADGKVYALDAATGAERWSLFTGGPVRFAPAVWRDRLFVASDDGFLYCLSAADGKILWKKQGGPDGRMVLGNDRLISHWPVRGGPVVVDDLVYFAAGIWPSDGIYLYALEAATGKVRWCNDSSGSIYMGQPHGGANAASGVAGQGYLVAAADQLLVPTGRAVPASFQRADGKFQFFHLQQYGHKGGASLLATGDFFLNSGLLFDRKTGTLVETIAPGVPTGRSGAWPAAVAALPDGVVYSTEKEVVVSRFADKMKIDKKGDTIRYRGLEKSWSVAAPGGTAVIAAGNQIIAAGPNQVSGIDIPTRRLAWSTEVDGIPHALAAANALLYVSTDKGTIHCFGTDTGAKPGVVRTRLDPAPYGDNALMAQAAAEIVRETGISEGYCVDLGCGDGALAYELARRTRLQIYAVDPDPEKVALARTKLAAAGLYGVRVSVHQADLARVPYPRHFANLVVSGRSVSAGAEPPAAAVERLQRPYGGVVRLGRPGQMRQWVRGPLAGAGQWTHQYADTGNTGCSDDALVKGPLTMLWFRDSDFDMPQRHGRGPAPVYLDGRLFVEGLNGIRAVDAYNGRTLWEYPLPDILRAYHGEHLMGASGTGSNLCVAPEGVFVRTGDRCLRLDVATGRKLTELQAPALPGGKPGTWGYLAVAGDLIFGSLANEQHVVRYTYRAADMSRLFTESRVLFALDAKTGQPRWMYPARHSIRHNAIAIGGGRVFLIDRPLAEADRLSAEKGKAVEHPHGELLSLDAATGKPLWKVSDDVFGTVLAVSVKHDALLMTYQPTAFRLPSEVGGRLAVFRASNGQRLWDEAAKYSSRPLINDRTIYAQGGAWDLLSGEPKPFDTRRSYGCGQMAASTHLMLYRSATLGYFDLLRPQGTYNYGGMRPGCWINALPVGGIVLIPDASAGCQCSYLNQAWLALQPRE